LTLAATFLPPSSYDYTLIHIFLPGAMLVLMAIERRNEAIDGLNAVALCFAYLMAAETELVWHRTGFAGATKAVVFLVLFYLALRYPFTSSFDERIDALNKPART
jgi:hypothetical protein